MEKNFYEKLVDDVKGICFGKNSETNIVSVKNKHQSSSNDNAKSNWGDIELKHRSKGWTSSGINGGDRRIAERRSGFERRVFVYDLCIPERRSGFDRRSGLDRRKSAA